MAFALLLVLAACKRDAPPEPAQSSVEAMGGSSTLQTTPARHGGECDPGDTAQCAISIHALTMPLGRAELIDAQCTHWNTSEPLPVCQCTLHTTRLSSEPDPVRPWEAWDEGTTEVVALPGHRPNGCSEYARAPSCLYCENEFPGCNVDDPGSCDIVCADMADRYDAEMAKTYDVNSRVARCGESSECEYVTEIDGACYARNPVQKDLPAFSCDLSDDELLRHKEESYVPSCDARPVAPCADGSSCPRGLACDNSGTCTTCSTAGSCSDAEAAAGRCPPSPRCAEGEVCIESRCIPQDNVECVTQVDCAEGEVCVLSGIDATGGRGNAATRSFCRVHDAYLGVGADPDALD